ncbi:hypothetical protein SK3146_06845 [Paenibacillus konkukensis]|uniref:Uncharacterized protein n=2 Tax=Paenibacillus konkukensis TaxID=2020716 RepID=A0ABY4RZ95_9BACL|nr:hypothetical protein SK3146_06845 [Paenibacillus konkukensis]
MDKYSIRDDESGLVIGYCEDIIGFLDYYASREKHFHEITLSGLRFDEAFVQHCKSARLKIFGMHFSILGQGGEPMGSYYFTPEKPISFYNDITSQEKITMSVSGALHGGPSSEALEIWKQWIIAKPVMKNIWASLSKEQRLGWLEVVRIHSQVAQKKVIEDQHYYLDMAYVTDRISFYCALGEAMNGRADITGLT